MPLTDLQCKNAPIREKPYKLTDSGGLYLHVLPTGRKYWRMKYKYDKKERLLTFGPYPLITLQEARFKQGDAQKMRRNGLSPAEIKQQKRQAKIEQAKITFEFVAREWHENYKSKWTKDYGQDILHRLEMDIFPEIGALPISSIRASTVLSALRKIEDRGACEMARRSMQYCSQIMRYAVLNEWIESNPLPDLRGAMRPFKHGHFAAIEADEIPNFIAALENNNVRIYPQTRRATKLLMLTFLRTGELRQGRWEEINFETATWTVPSLHMKKKDRSSHIVPLSRQALEILKEQKELSGKSEWIFPNQVRPRECMSDGAILGVIKRIGFKGKMTGHGFRALAMSTLKEALGYRHEVVDRQLAHSHQNKVDAAYDRAKFLDERIKMMQDWADYLDKEANNGKVVQLKTKRAA